MQASIRKGADLSKILKKSHENKWIATTLDYKKLLAVGDTLVAVLDKTSNVENKAVFKALPNLAYAPFGRK